MLIFVLIRGGGVGVDAGEDSKAWLIGRCCWLLGGLYGGGGGGETGASPENWLGRSGPPPGPATHC